MNALLQPLNDKSAQSAYNFVFATANSTPTGTARVLSGVPTITDVVDAVLDLVT